MSNLIKSLIRLEELKRETPEEFNARVLKKVNEIYPDREALSRSALKALEEPLRKFEESVQQDIMKTIKNGRAEWQSKRGEMI